MTRKVGILHPGQMGISIAAATKNGGNKVYWVSADRSPETRQRAEEQGLTELQSLKALCQTCEIILCVCPPHAAEDVASAVLKANFQGLYVDANAVAPQRVQNIGDLMSTDQVEFVDGSIIGGPAWQPGRTWLYLSGNQSQQVADLFVNGPLETEVVGPEIGKASAIKMCFAAYTKGTTALLSTILAAAEALDVRVDLEKQWSRGGSDFATQAHNRTRRVTAKAWRFTGEMEEIAATFESVGLPGGFHLAAVEIYNRIAKFKGAEEPPHLNDVLAALLQK
jgi:3-hydroxyisobutyrate dehydrogenase-like beta-hydroxyacid dehydrogenase